MSWWTDLIGGPKTTQTDTTVTTQTKTNWGLIIGGIILGIGALVGLAWALGAFGKKKNKETDAKPG